MRVILTLPAANIYDKQHRVCGHKHTPTSRDSLKQLKALIPRLKELGVQRVICSDLDEQSGEYLAHKLGVPLEPWQSLRRFNWGRLHGVDQSRANGVRDAITSDEVPVKGGDSKLSFTKRMSHSRERLSQLKDLPLIIAGTDEVTNLLGKDVGKLAHCRIYEADINGTAPKTLVSSA